MKIIKFIALLLLTGLTTQAQKYELGQVTKEELAEKTHPADPSAGAAILYSKGSSSMQFSERDGFSLVTVVEMKIKIYNKDGYDWANKIVRYYSSETDRENVDFSKTFTYNLVDGAVKKTKLKSEGEFTEKINKFWTQKKIMMPDVKQGSIIEYQYTIYSPFISVLPEWRFQESIPVNHSEYSTRIPEYFVFTPNFRGYIAPKVTNTSRSASIISTSRERSEGMVNRTNFETEKTTYQENITTYMIDKLPGMKDERYVNNIDNYTSSIVHELTMTKYPNSPVKTFSNSWQDVANTIYKYDDFGPELKKTSYFEADVTALLAGKTTSIEKVSAIFEHVKNRMNWNKFVGYSCDAGVKKAYTDKVGNVAEINLMLTAMLRFAGLDANPVLVSTRANKIALFPTRTAFNYVIASVQIDGKNVLLDATSKSAMPNILPVRAINWMGRLIRVDGTSSEVDLSPQTISKEVMNLAVIIDNDGKATGKARDQYYDYNAYIFRENYSGISQESYLQNLENEHKGIEISGYKINNDKDLTKPIVEEYDFTHNAVADIIADKIYINPMLFLSQSENPFKQEKREYPIDFVFPHQDKYMIGIKLPDGYVVESIPQPISLSMEDNLGSFKYNLVATGRQVQVVVTLDINYASFGADYYETLKSFYQKVIEKQNEKIVLKKA